MQLIPFSKHRYATRLNLVRHSGEYPTLGNPELDYLERSVYGMAPETPVVLRVNGRYIVPRGEDSIPANTLAIPNDIADEDRFDLPAENAETFVVSPEMAELYLGSW